MLKRKSEMRMFWMTLFLFLISLTQFCDSASFYFNYNSTLRPVYDEDTKNDQYYIKNINNNDE